MPLSNRVQAQPGRYREALRAVTRLAGWSFGIHRTDAAPTQALLGLYRALAKD